VTEGAISLLLLLLVSGTLIAMTLVNRALRRDLADASATRTSLLRDLEAARTHAAETRQILTMLSDSAKTAREALDEAQGTAGLLRGLAQKTEAALELHLSEARKAVASVADRDAYWERVRLSMQDQINWLRRCVAIQASHDRAATNLEAERLAQEGDARSEAIALGPAQAPPMPTEPQGHLFSTQRRRAEPAGSPYDEDVRAAGRSEPVGAALASAGGPVPGTE